MIAPKVKSAIEVITTKAVCANNQFLRFNGSMNPTSAIKDEITIKRNRMTVKGKHHE